MSKRMGRVCSLLAASSLLTLAGVAHATPMGISSGSGALLKGAAVASLNDRTAVVTTADPGRAVKFEVFLPLRNRAGLEALLAAQQDSTSASYHKWLTPAQFKAQFGASPASVANVSSALKGSGLQVSAVNAQSLTVTGTVAQVNSAFGVALKNVVAASGTTRLVSPTVLVLPAALKAEGATIASFNGLPAKKSMAKVITGALPANRNHEYGAYWYDDLKQAYNFPAYNTPLAGGATPDGTGVNVAIVIDSTASTSDATAFFDHESFTTHSGKSADPTFTILPLNGGAATTNDIDEANLDTQQVLGGAPGSNVTVIDIPSLYDEDILGAYVHIDEFDNWDLVNSSFGGCELQYTPAYNGGTDFSYIAQAYDSIFAQGNAEGISFMASSGDSAGLSCPEVGYFTGAPPAKGGTKYSFVPSIEYPASSPHVTAVGGGNLITTAPPSPQTTPTTLTSKWVSENAYGDPEVDQDPYGQGRTLTGGYWGAGGGRSAIFAALPYQQLVNTGSPNGKRTVPDIGMQVGGCPGGLSITPCGSAETGQNAERSYVVTAINGKFYGLIGTSVASPEFVGAAAIYVQANGRQGNLNTYIYQQGAKQQQGGGITSYHLGNSIPGFDGRWDNTGPYTGGYDYLYGNGSPRVKDLFGFSSLGKIGDPQTSSNP